MEKDIEVSTFFVGTQQDASELANEWNELLKTNEFYARATNNADVYLIRGMVSEQDLQDFDIEHEFMVNVGQNE